MFQLVNKTLTDDAGLFYMRPLMYMASGELILQLTRQNFVLSYTVYENKFKSNTNGVSNVEQAANEGLPCVCCIMYNGQHHAVVLDSIIDDELMGPVFNFKNSYTNAPSITMSMRDADAPVLFYYVNILYSQ